MPLYRLVTYAKPDTTSEKLADVFRGVARMVYRERGQFRRINNMGIRPLAYPFRRPREKYEAARFVECTYDLAPRAIPEVERLLRAEDSVLRFVHMKDEGELAAFRRGVAKEIAPKVPTPAQRVNGEFNPATMSVDR
ncbi:hypothetical protein FNF27_02837 [Cafeteria roenbergensis]|uniref:Ribosomal protein S6 n=1 Tax=Cafeteria roenbergensis TaxID=33653 RepID=A0A5A8D7F3_CAFRO|nr:hypothetical protein FNF29_03212 [Cafeteria roenbergensis]KAA0161108.1 hypothetical protein FNF31_03949 [Cafeteria roenbergensis]KAA0170878.1 hypothetical protein FNF28_01151 [Cafeteria roenbergensis]KAA0175751.1 hypothetical protein FNF27_02837 [Cafeteria roenbergensis]|eukprot:KAA0153395.1 hypothetical protein FNF29_03212 [Cafeteria roenbergensis]